MGQSASFTVTSGTSASYQWQVSTNGGGTLDTMCANGATYSGATTGTLTISNVSAGMSGSEYRAVLTATAGGATSDSAAGTLFVGNAHLSNLSSRAFVGTGANALFAGFVIKGTGSKQILLRGIGPTLGTYGVSGTLATPQLTLDGAGSVNLGTNTVWGGSAHALANVNGLGRRLRPPRQPRPIRPSSSVVHGGGSLFLGSDRRR